MKIIIKLIKWILIFMINTIGIISLIIIILYFK